MTADLGHLAHRVPDGQGHPAETERREAARVSRMRHELAARVLMDAVAEDDQGAARRHLATLRHDPDIDPWSLLEQVAELAPRRVG